MLSKVLLLGVSALLRPRVAVAVGPVTTFVVANTAISPDGFTRSAVLVNGVFPGPTLQANKGDTFNVYVQNRLTDNNMDTQTTIHWHGIFQTRNNWADGTSSVTQCPIIPNESFLHTFSVPYQAGTYWYHSHFAAQYCDGLRGPLVIYDPKDPHRGLYEVDNEDTIITLSDWYHEYSKGQTSLNAASTLINGKGRYKDKKTGEISKTSLAVVNVVQGKKYRFRIISMSCDGWFTFSIESHTFAIIEADGENTKELVVDSFEILAGQRYSAVLHANQSIGNYWIRSDPKGKGKFEGGQHLAILRYFGAKPTEPTTDPEKNLPTDPLIESKLHPYDDPAAPGIPGFGKADINLFLDYNKKDGRWYMNGASFEPPTVPALLQILSGAMTADELLPKGSYTALPRNKVVELTLPGVAPGTPHPFHLHGHTFSVVRSASSSTYNYVDPVRRDTVSTGGSGNMTTIRFITDNAGPWFLHCHIDWHLVLGLAYVFAEDIPGTKIDPVPAEWMRLCLLYLNATKPPMPTPPPQLLAAPSESAETSLEESRFRYDNTESNFCHNY